MGWIHAACNTFMPHATRSCSMQKVCVLSTIVTVRLSFRSEQQQSTAAATKMLFAVSSVFLISTITLSAMSFASSFLDSYQEEWNDTDIFLRRLLALLFPIPILANSSANFLVLLVTMETFRTTLKKVLQVKKKEITSSSFSMKTI